MDYLKNEGYTLVDSSVFLAIFKQEGLHSESFEMVEGITKRQRCICVTLIIIQEVISGMDDFIKEQCKGSNMIQTDEKQKEDMWEVFLSGFSNYIVKGEILHPSKNFTKKLEEINKSSVRCGEKDKINLALALMNDCDEFITIDNPLKKDERTIRKISKKKFSIISVN